jgi:hypothetical protein
MFKEIIASQMAFAERVTKWDSDYNINQRIARNYFFGKKAEPAKAEPAKAETKKK